MLIRPNTEVTQHLRRFGILDYMGLLHHGFHKVLVDELPECAPELTILHDQQMVTSCNQDIGEIRRRSIAVFAAFLIDKLLDDTSIGDDHCGSGSQLEGIESSVFLGPFRKSG